MSNTEFNKVFSKKLKYYLAKNNMTQLQLSTKLGVGTTSVSNWCNGLKSPRMDKVDAMCRLFNCRRSDLMEETQNEGIPKIMDYYNQLNLVGQEEAEKRVEELTHINKYTEHNTVVKMPKPEYLTPNAAHANNYQDHPEDLKNLEEDIMDDINF